MSLPVTGWLVLFDLVYGIEHINDNVVSDTIYAKKSYSSSQNVCWDLFYR